MLLSRRLLSRLSLVPSPSRSPSARRPFVPYSSLSAGADPDSPETPSLESDAAAASDNEEAPSPSSGDPPPRTPPYMRPLENGLDQGIYKAILVGRAGQRPVQKQLRSGHSVVLFTLATGGIRNNRRPNDKEDPREYAEACAVQWHRVSVYPARLGGIALKHVKPGSTLYIEGNLETKIYNDPLTGIARRIREIGIRRDGRLLLLGDGDDAGKTEEKSLRNIGQF